MVFQLIANTTQFRIISKGIIEPLTIALLQFNPDKWIDVKISTPIDEKSACLTSQRENPGIPQCCFL